MRISDWSSDVCSSDLNTADQAGPGLVGADARRQPRSADGAPGDVGAAVRRPHHGEQPEDDVAAPLGNAAQPQQREAGEPDVDEAARRAAERRVGKECVSRLRSGWGQSKSTKKK